ncbi:hypothetical protein R1flu_005857 [Riccia fluitans]|uniref:Uncharacterized protein n=1 Tax=Riccia fluitans TaxID=41844 RepID=A0ABD1YUL1_9MARC
MDPRGLPLDNAARRFVLNLDARGREMFFRQNPHLFNAMPEYQVIGWLDNITRGAIQWVTRNVEAMEHNAMESLFQQNRHLAYHFPHLDRANYMARRRGPVLPLSPYIESSFIRSWHPLTRELEFWARPWLRHRFPELAPPGGWPPRLLLPHRDMREHGRQLAIQGPPELHQNWPIRGSYTDPEPHNYVESQYRPRRRNVPLVEIYRNRVRRTPPPRINGRVFRRAAPTWYEPRNFRRMTTEQYFDPTRYRRGDRPHGYINGAPPHPYHDFLPEGVPVEDIEEGLYVEGPSQPANDPRDEVDFMSPESREYSARGSFEPVWDDNFTPAEYRLGHSPPR